MTQDDAETKYAVFRKPIFPDDKTHTQIGEQIHEGSGGNPPIDGSWPPISRQVFDEMEKAKEVLTRSADFGDLLYSDYYIVEFPVGGKMWDGEVVYGDPSTEDA